MANTGPGGPQRWPDTPLPGAGGGAVPPGPPPPYGARPRYPAGPAPAGPSQLPPWARPTTGPAAGAGASPHARLGARTDRVLQALVDEGGPLVAVAVVAGVLLVVLGALVGGFSDRALAVSGVAGVLAHGFRARLLVAFGPDSVEQAAVVVLAVALAGLVPGRRPSSLRRPALFAAGCTGAFLALAALVRLVVLLSFVGDDVPLSLGSALAALGTVPLGALAALWAGALVGDSGQVGDAVSPSS